MNKVALGALWLFSLALAAWIAYELARPEAELVVVPAEPLTGTTEPFAHPASNELDFLRADNISLRAQLEAARNATLQQALAEILRQAKESANANADKHVATAGTVLTRVVNGERRNTGMFGNVEEFTGALVAFARMGDKGIDFLLAAANDSEHYTEEERHAAKELLTLLPHPDTLNYFLTEMKSATEESEAEFEYAYSLQCQVRSLPTEDLTPFSAELNSQASRWLERGRPDLACTLGLLHSNPTMLNQLRYTLAWPPNSFVGVVNQAERIHTDAARTFLTEAERTYKDDGSADFSMQNHISQILERW